MMVLMAAKTTPPAFMDWLDDQLTIWNLSDSEASRRAGLSRNGIYEIRSGIRPGVKKVRALARLFGADEQHLFQLAGILAAGPPVMPAVAEEREAVAILRSLPVRDRAMALNVLRAIAETAAPAPAVSPPSSRRPDAISIPDDDDMIGQQLIEEFAQFPPWARERALRTAELWVQLAAAHSPSAPTTEGEIPDDDVPQLQKGELLSYR